MVHLFIHLLISANNEDGEWRGIQIKRGQLITGRKSLNEGTGISEQKIRTCLKRLENTKEITIQSTNQYSIITICKYDNYQENKKKTNQRINQQLTSDQPTDNHKQEYKDIKNIYSAFYDSEILKSNNDSEYIEIVKCLFGENNLGIQLICVLKMETQLSYEQFQRIKVYKKKYSFSTIQLLEAMENWGNPKKYKTVYGTFQTFLKRHLKTDSL